MNPHRLTVFGVAVALLLPATPAVASSGGHDDDSAPSTIDLPGGFAPEGVASGEDDTFYAGSLADGRVARGSLDADAAEVLVSSPLVAPAVGLKADLRHDLLWVAGGPTGKAAVYDLDSGDGVVAVTLTTAPSFVNDVTLTRNAVYFTNSFAPEIYRVPVSRDGEVGAPETIALKGPAAAVVPGFNLNGIAATKDGRTLIVVNSANGELYTVDAATGASALIDLGGASVVTGDGLLLTGRTLYVLQNGGVPSVVPNQIAVIRLNRKLTEGRIVDTITTPLFKVATTLAKVDDTLVAVNAQFGATPVDPKGAVVVLPLDD